jgi:phage shock protein A
MDWWHRWGRMQRASDQLVTRAKSAQAQPQVMDAVKSIDILDPTSEVTASKRRFAARRPDRAVTGEDSAAPRFKTSGPRTGG